MQNEVKFFQSIALELLEFVSGNLPQARTITSKGHTSDYATDIDIEAERRISAQITETFPGDTILAEEEHANASFATERVWIIDPICGTNNLSRGISLFCTTPISRLLRTVN